MLLLIMALPARAAATGPPLFEAEGLVVRFAPAKLGLSIFADRIAWRDASGALSLQGVEAGLKDAKAPGNRALSMRARAVALGDGAPPLRDVSLSGTLVPARDANPWAVNGLLLRIAGRDALAGSIVGSTTGAAGGKPADAQALRIELDSREMLDLAWIAPALGWAGAGGWRASGRAGLTLSARLPARGRGRIDARGKIQLIGAGLSSPGDTPQFAADKLNGHVEFTAAGDLSPRNVRFSLSAEASDFEFLSGVYYANLAGQTLRATSSGTVRGARVEGLDAELSAPGLGTVRVAGAMVPGGARPGDEVRLEADRVNLARLWPLAVSEPLGDSHRWIKGSTMRGSARLEARWKRIASGWTLEGLAEASGLRWERSAAGTLFDIPEARLPFDLRSPSPRRVPDPSAVAPSRYGRIRVARFRAGSWAGGETIVEPLIHEGGLLLRRPAVVPFYGGAIRIEDLEGSDILEPGRRIRFHGRFAGVELGALTRGLGLPEFRGSLRAEIPDVRIDGDHLRAPGRFETTVFGGRITVSGLEVERLFSRLPRIGMDVSARGLSLEQATRALDLGRMSGTLEGSIRGLVIERGQPQAFFADFSVVDRKGVSKWVSADFVKDVATLFGSGNAVSTTLNRGVNRFFQRYRYDAFGFTCRLKNDVFYPRGKIRRDGVEYLMWGRWNYVRIVIRDPGRGIPFSFLVRQMRTLATPGGEIEQRSRTPLDWLWPPSWRVP